MRIPSLHRQILHGLWFCLCVAISVSTAFGEPGADTKSRETKKAARSSQAKTLIPLLKSPSEPLWEKGFARLTPESMDDDDVVNAIAQFVNRETKAGRFSPSLARGISLLGSAKQPQASETLIPLLRSKDSRVAMLTADSTASNQNLDLIQPIMRLSERAEFKQHYGFRRCVIDAVARYQDKSAMDFLVQQLADSDGQLKFEIAMTLQSRTGQDFGGKADEWQKWWNANRDSFVFSRVDLTPSIPLSRAPSAIPWDEVRPSFYGMTIYAKRVVFVIDRSGSMRTTVDGVSRLERAQQELQRAIRGLSESDSFNIVAFDNEMEVFHQRLVPASEANKIDGIRFTYGLVPKGDTACYEPLKMAIEASNNLELILFVSDGEPNAGAIVDPSAIVIAISNHNLTQRTTIHTLGIDARGPHEAFLKDLADKNGGKLLLVR